MNHQLFKVLLINLLLSISISCDPEFFGDTVVDETEVETGILEVQFEIKHNWIPSDRIIRVGLHIAESSMKLYTGDFLQSAYVTNNNSLYSFKLLPGDYYYDAVIACICSADSCITGGFPGNQNSKKHSKGKFTINKKKTTSVKPAFN